MPLSPSQLADIREACKADPFYLASVLGLQVQWFHRSWLTFCMSHPKHVLEAPRGFGKSTICTTVYVIWRILRDPNVRVLIVSKTETQASRFLQEIRGHLEQNAILIAAFGAFVGTGKWTDTALVVAQRKAVSKEATVSAMGLEGPIVGGHWEVEIVDDPFDEESSRSDLLRDRACDWLFTTLQPTLVPGGVIGIRCTRYHYEDMAGKIEREQATDTRTGEAYIYRIEAQGDPLPPRSVNARWKVLQTPAILRDGASLWEARFPLEDRINPDGSITEGLSSMRHGSPQRERAFLRQFMLVCLPDAEGERGTVFEVAKFRAWEPSEAPPPQKLLLYMRHDPAWTSREEAAKRTNRDRKPDMTAITIAGLDPASGRFYVLDHHRGLYSDAEGIAKAREIATEWKAKGLKRYRVERTGLQITHAPDFYRRIRAAMPIPVEFHNPQKNKVAHAEPFALAVSKGRVLWNPAIFDRYPDLKSHFDLFPTKGVPDDDVDAVSGAFLMAERRDVDHRPFARQFGPAPASAAPSRFSRPDGGAAAPSRFTRAAGAGGESRYSRPA